MGRIKTCEGNLSSKSVRQLQQGRGLMGTRGSN